MREKILIICRHEKWCVTWFNQLIRFLAYNKANEESQLMVNKRHKCICVPNKEIIFASESQRNNSEKAFKPDRVIEWDGEEVKMLWDLI